MFYSNLNCCELVFYDNTKCNNCNCCILNNRIDYLNLKEYELINEFNDLLKYDILNDNDIKNYKIKIIAIKHKIKILKNELDKINSF